VREVALGQCRRRAPCLPAELLSCFAAFPLEYAGHGHPGLLFAKRSPGDSEGPAETWIEASLSCTTSSFLPRTRSCPPGTDGGGALGIPSVLLVCM